MTIDYIYMQRYDYFLRLLHKVPKNTLLNENKMPYNIPLGFTPLTREPHLDSA